jgi:hypothetical protein
MDYRCVGIRVVEDKVNLSRRYKVDEEGKKKC